MGISILAMIATLIMGGVLGLLGGGGSILAVPILLELVELPGEHPEKVAIAMSVLLVGTTSLMAAAGHARAGNVDWRTGIIFGAFGMVGAFLGGIIAGYIPGTVLIALFAVMMLVTAVAMLRGKQRVEPEDGGVVAQEKLPIMKIGLEGLAVGAVTGLVGAGGGFLVVPALVLLGGLPMKRAIGTSLLVIAMKSYAAFAGYAQHITIDAEFLQMSAVFIGLATVGTFAGAYLTRMIDANKLRTGFGVFVLVMGVYVMMSQLEKLNIEVSPLVVLVGMVLAGVAGALMALRQRGPEEASA